MAYTFAYNADELRTEKSVGNEIHTYYFGNQLLAEEWGNYIVTYNNGG